MTTLEDCLERRASWDPAAAEALTFARGYRNGPRRERRSFAVHLAGFLILGPGATRRPDPADYGLSSFGAQVISIELGRIARGSESGVRS